MRLRRTSLTRSALRRRLLFTLLSDVLKCASDDGEHEDKDTCSPHKLMLLTDRCIAGFSAYTSGGQNVDALKADRLGDISISTMVQHANLLRSSLKGCVKEN